MLYCRDLISAFDYPFSKKKSDRERFVIAGRSHGDRDRFMDTSIAVTKPHAYLQRLLHCESVTELLSRSVSRNALNINF